MRIKYLHEDVNPIIPAIGDIRICYELTYSNSKFEAVDDVLVPKATISVARCVEIKEHHVVYELIGKKYCLAIPFEMLDTFGVASIDAAIVNIVNQYMTEIISNSNNNSFDFVKKSIISTYYSKLKNLVVLSRQVLKEAEKAKQILSKI